MRILIVSQYFWPENFRINDLVLGLIERGHKITVLTGIPNYPDGHFFAGYGIFRKNRDNYHGAKVIRIPIIPRGKGCGFRLALNYFSFVVSGCMFVPLRCREKYDLIFIYEPSPITVALPALLIKAIRNIPVMFWVQDLWPESLAATGAITARRSLNIVAHIVRFIYRRCDKILITSESYRKSVEHYNGSPKHIHYFPQCAEDFFQPVSEKKNIAALNSLPPGFWVMFAGNIGAAQDFETIIAAAERIKNYKEIHWIIVGDGRKRKWAESEVIKRGLSSNFHFLGRHPAEVMPQFFSHADAMLVTLKNEPIFALTIPAKIQSYLACSMPIIAALDGEGAGIIDSSGAGYTCPAEDPDAFAKTVLKMYKTPKRERVEMGMRGRAYCESNFDRDRLLDKLDKWMSELVCAGNKKTTS